MCAAVDESLRHILCSYNPFDDVARPQHPDGRFSQLHVPAVLREPRERIIAAIDAYRVTQFSSLRDLPASRVVKILGIRGSGKTHLYEAVLNRDDGRHQLLISRETENFDEGMPFEEYMFQLLTTALHGRHPVYGYRYFDAVAGQLTRRLLLNTLRELGPTDRLFVTAPSRWRRLLLLWRGGNAISQRFDELVEELQDPATSAELCQLCQRYELDPAAVAKWALARITRWERGDETPSIIRRELYRAMIRAALLGDRGALQGFLEADYHPSSRGRLLHRADVVRHLLHAVREACALVQLPVVFAFDNLEGLLAPAGILQPRRAAAFLEGLAQAVDHTRGFLFLLFFEQGLFQEAQQHAGTFARSRLELGVQVPGRCRIAEVDLQPPLREELRELVAGRLAILRPQLPHADALPVHFPFSSPFLDELDTRTDQPIRGKLESLREEYNRVVFGNVPLPPPTVGPALLTREELGRIWEESLLEAGRILEISLADRHADLTRGLSLLLQAGLPWPEKYPGVERETLALPIGDNPRHGFATVVKCGHAPHRVAIGFLLATGKGMPLDLQSKFAAFSDERAQADFLRVLWPTLKQAADLVTALPDKTREVWDEATQRHPACLSAIENATLRKILAYSLLPEKIRKQEADLPADMLTSFVRERCVDIFALVMPRCEGS